MLWKLKRYKFGSLMYNHVYVNPLGFWVFLMPLLNIEKNGSSSGKQFIDKLHIGTNFIGRSKFQ